MFIAGDGDNHVMVLADSRSGSCVEAGGVLDFWGFGRRVLGAREWGKTLRVALREYRAPGLSAKALKGHLSEVKSLIQAHDIKTVVILQAQHYKGVAKTSDAWHLFGRPGPLVPWAGTVLEEDGVRKCPVLNPANYEIVYQPLIETWFRRAFAHAPIFEWGKLHTVPGEPMLEALEAIAQAGEPVSVDIETSMSRTTLTALGLATRTHAVSMPWDGYQIAGTIEYDPALSTYAHGPALKARALAILAGSQPKVGHNLSFDKRELMERGIAFGGECHDTLLLARAIYPQYRRGLQQVAATEFFVEPWKSIWKPKNKQGIDGWLANPEGLRLYNAKDTKMTAHLFHSLSEKLK